MPQSGHSHILTSLGVRLLRERAPAVLADALAAGAELLDLTAAAPAARTPFVRERQDAELAALAVRRVVLDDVLRRAALRLPGVTISYGTTVRGLVADASGRRPAAVVTDTGEHVPADIVLDATGRRAVSRGWAGARGESRTTPTTLRALTRFYRLTDPGSRPGPLNRGNAAGGIWNHYAAVVHPAEQGLFAVTLGVLPGDPGTAALRRAGAFTAVAGLSPGVTPWLDRAAARPVTEVRAISFPPNTLHPGPADDGHLDGVLAVGDAACVTDPTYGRGMSLALVHAFGLADVLAAHPVPDDTQRKLAGALADDLLRPWYEQAVQDTALRTRAWQAAAGAPAPGPTTATESAEPTEPPAGRPSLARTAVAAAWDGAVWRGLTRVLMSLDTPAAVFDDPDFRARVQAAPPEPPPGTPAPPTRERLLEAVAAAEGARP